MKEVKELIEAAQELVRQAKAASRTNPLLAVPAAKLSKAIAKVFNAWPTAESGKPSNKLLEAAKTEQPAIVFPINDNETDDE